MPTVTQENSRHDQERFERYEAERLLVNEVTDLSERVPLPMDNSFEYTIEPDGHLYYLGESLGQVLENNLEVTRLAVASNPIYVRYYQHAHIERQEYDEQRRLACLAEGEDDLLVVLSPQVNEIGKHLTMVRVYTRTDEGISATSISFDRSDNECLDNVARFFGESISSDASPEDVLGMRLWGKKADIPSENTRAFLARLHDVVLEEKYGGVWSGGRPGTCTIDAQMFVRNQEDLLSEHIGLVKAIKKRRSPDEHELLEKVRYQTTAQLVERLKGLPESPNREVAGERASANGEKFENSCPTVGSAARASQEVGLMIWKQGECRVCMTSGLVGLCSVCASCERADNAGHDLDAIHRKALTRRAIAHQAVSTVFAPFFRQEKARAGQPIRSLAGGAIHETITRRTVLGGVVHDVHDRRTGVLLRTVSI